MAEDLDAVIDELSDQVHAVVSDTARFSQQDSYDILEGLISSLRVSEQALLEELDG